MVAGPGIEVQGLDKLLRKLGENTLIRPAVVRLVNRVAVYVQGEARKGAKPHPGDRGELARSIRVDQASPLRPLGSMSASVGTSKIYAWPVEKGRRAGKMPPVDAIADFLRRHGSDPALGFVVARAIGRRGTKGIHYMRDAVRAGRTKIKEFVPGAVREIQQAWRAR